jgi:hypothetical protein
MRTLLGPRRPLRLVPHTAGGVRVGVTLVATPTTSVPPATDANGNPVPATTTTPNLTPVVAQLPDHLTKVAQDFGYGALTGAIAGGAVGLVFGAGLVAGATGGALYGGVSRAALSLFGFTR